MNTGTLERSLHQRKQQQRHRRAPEHRHHSTITMAVSIYTQLRVQTSKPASEIDIITVTKCVLPREEGDSNLWNFGETRRNKRCN